MASGLQSPVVEAQETSAERRGEVAKTAALEAALINHMCSARGDPGDAGGELQGKPFTCCWQRARKVRGDVGS